jgi:hypothetical protein
LQASYFCWFFWHFWCLELNHPSRKKNTSPLRIYTIAHTDSIGPGMNTMKSLDILGISLPHSIHVRAFFLGKESRVCVSPRLVM